MRRVRHIYPPPWNLACPPFAPPMMGVYVCAPRQPRGVRPRSIIRGVRVRAPWRVRPSFRRMPLPRTCSLRLACPRSRPRPFAVRALSSCAPFPVRTPFAVRSSPYRARPLLLFAPPFVVPPLFAVRAPTVCASRV
jgi:hypothetical protein